MLCLPNRRDQTVFSNGKAISSDSGAGAEAYPRLLVGDDEPRLLLSLCAILRNAGFEVDGARDGASVCEQALLASYDLILVNINMPGTDGFDVLTWLKDAGSDIPVVVVSGFSDYRTIRRAFRLGASDYLLKPYDVNELIQVVSKTIRTQRSPPNTSASKARTVTNEFFRQALDHLPELVFALDKQKRIRYLNHRAEKYLGISEQEWVGQPFAQLVHEDDAIRMKWLLSGPGGQAPIAQEVTLRTRHGESNGLVCEIIVVSAPDSTLSTQTTDNANPDSIQYLVSARDITQRKQTLALMEFRAFHDALTGLPNRTLFWDRLSLAVSQAHRKGQKLALLFVDLNDFKAVNDTHGHRAGDELLQEVASGFKQCLREGDTLSRYGGDEFTVLLPSVSEKQDASTVAHKLLKSLHVPFLLDGAGVSISVGASIGIAVYPDDGDEAETLLERADRAMYDIKRTGKNDFRFYG